MAYLSKLKLSPITNLSDARFAAAAGIEYMGFCFDPNSADFVLPIKAKEMIEWTTGSHVVGEFGNQSLEEITEMSDLLNVDVVGINNQLLPDEFQQIGKPIIKMVNLDELSLDKLAIEFQAYDPFVDAFQLNGNLNWALVQTELKNTIANYKIIWNLPTNAETIKEVVEFFKPYAIVLSAGSEEKTGMKEYDDLYTLLELLEVQN
jgi:phosphoribosylanthranilate isomerase